VKPLLLRSRFGRWVTAFGAVSAVDLLLTWLLLEKKGGAYEANPLAAAVLAGLGWAGLVGFKAAAVVLVLVLAHRIRRFREPAAVGVLRLGCLAVAFVVAYGLFFVDGRARGPRAVLQALAAQEAVVRDRARASEKVALCAKQGERLAAQVAAGKMPLARAVAELNAYLEAIGHEPTYLSNYCGGLTKQASLAAFLIREVGCGLLDRPVEARKQYHELRKQFAPYHPRLPAFAWEPFARALAAAPAPARSGPVVTSRAAFHGADATS
jgi:hypothetical protein